MFTYVQIIDKGSKIFEGYVDYKFSKGTLSMTMVRGCRKLHRMDIPISKITNLKIDEYYGEPRISFSCGSAKCCFLNSGFGESQYLEHHICNLVKA